MNSPTSLVYPLTMQQGELCDVVRRFITDSTHSTLVVAAPFLLQKEVEHALIFFLSDMTSVRYHTVLYSTKNSQQTVRTGILLEHQLTDYAIELLAPNARQYKQERLMMAGPPQRTNPEFESVHFRLLFRQRDSYDMRDQNYPLALYDNLSIHEFRQLLRQKTDKKRVLIMYVTSELGIGNAGGDGRSSLIELRSASFIDPAVNYYEMGQQDHQQQQPRV